MLKEADDLSWYARKAASLRSLGQEPGIQDIRAERRLQALLERLKRAGIKGDVATMTLYTRRLPPGCRGCLKGAGSNLYVTGLCTRSCFFCFNRKPRTDEIIVHGLRISEPAQAVDVVRRYRLRSIGISGGEPLLFPDRVLQIIRVLRQSDAALRIDLYTNGDRSNVALLRRLKDAGLNSVRFNLVARDFDLTPLTPALQVFSEVAVEVPVFARQLPRLKEMVLALDQLGVPFLNIHDLFICDENREGVLDHGYAPREAAGLPHLLWQPTVSSAEAALELLLFALKRAKTLSVYFCSCGTQETISRRGLRRRAVSSLA